MLTLVFVKNNENVIVIVSKKKTNSNSIKKSKIFLPLKYLNFGNLVGYDATYIFIRKLLSVIFLFLECGQKFCLVSHE